MLLRAWTGVGEHFGFLKTEVVLIVLMAAILTNLFRLLHYYSAGACFWNPFSNIYSTCVILTIWYCLAFIECHFPQMNSSSIGLFLKATQRKDRTNRIWKSLYRWTTCALSFVVCHFFETKKVTRIALRWEYRCDLCVFFSLHLEESKKTKKKKQEEKNN